MNTPLAERETQDPFLQAARMNGLPETEAEPPVETEPRKRRGRPRGSGKPRTHGVSVSASGKQTSAALPTREIARMLARMVGGSTMLLATWLAEPSAAMTVAEAQAIAKPAARILSRSVWFHRLYTWAIRTTARDRDTLALLLAIGAYSYRVAPLVAAKVNDGGGVHNVLLGGIERIRWSRAQHAERQAATHAQRGAASRGTNGDATGGATGRRERQPRSGSGIVPPPPPPSYPRDGATGDGGQGSGSDGAAQQSQQSHWPIVAGGYGALVADALETGVVFPGSGGVRPPTR